ncbi:HNH endonuclease [Microvirga roseola]|uniref:HNH endonuclease n=1 Tax=Microvirga roseola TaxID=2883126 RepID=UPI001E620E72|nr:HNH endonuclease domain-containing protein [Microvirga roseola]
MPTFLTSTPSLEDNWRAVILFGKNTASYKFALGQALLSLGRNQNDLVRLDELAIPYAKVLCDHLKQAPKQGTFKKSTFLQECQKWIDREYSDDRLRDATVKHGFGDVLDAFHNLGGGRESVRFFYKEQRPQKGIRLTSEFFRLANESVASDLEREVEGRWRLVETAWEAGVTVPLIETDDHGERLVALFGEEQPEGLKRRRRISVTSSRDALNGYQKGHCFYCFTQIRITAGASDLADVDHVFPHVLGPRLPGNVNGIWNLVLACRDCNRGISGKSDLAPALELVERLYTRNEFLIGSKHPLGETIVRQTGKSPSARAGFLQSCFTAALTNRIATWKPILRAPPVF